MGISFSFVMYGTWTMAKRMNERTNYICWLNVSSEIREIRTSQTICHISNGNTCGVFIIGYALSISLIQLSVRNMRHTHTGIHLRELTQCSWRKNIQIESQNNWIFQELTRRKRGIKSNQISPFFSQIAFFHIFWLHLQKFWRKSTTFTLTKFTVRAFFYQNRIFFLLHLYATELLTWHAFRLEYQKR